jgi:hypothetical protein
VGVNYKVITEFLEAARRPASLDPIHNTYVGFGFMWGVAADLLVFGRPGAESTVATGAMLSGTFDGPGHILILAVLPLLMGWVFGTMGTIRAEHANYRRRTLKLLDREVRHRTRNLRDMYLQAVLSLSSAIEAKNEYTHGHCRRVFDYAQAAAEQLGVSEQDLETLEHACYVHDIGKIGLPDAILDKPDRLTKSEYDLVKQHSARGQEILAPITGFEDVALLVRWHHERLDGTGYPDGLSGDQVPLLARIIAVADTLDAMVSDRPYRSGMPMKRALAELRRCAGLPFDVAAVPGRDKEPRQHFDPRVVEALEVTLKQGFVASERTGEQPPIPELRSEVAARLNCWEQLKCGAETCTRGDQGWCPVPFDESLDGVNGGKNGGRTCWSVVGAKCRAGDAASPPGDAEVCVACPVLSTVRNQEGPVWFQLAPQAQRRGRLVVEPGRDDVPAAAPLTEARPRERTEAPSAGRSSAAP